MRKLPLWIRWPELVAAQTEFQPGSQTEEWDCRPESQKWQIGFMAVSFHDADHATRRCT
jgi:hypothetical protein